MKKIAVPENDWNDHSKAEIWRASWAKHCNRYLAKDKQIDHRSYARQGKDKVPTIHEGVVARQMEAEGKTADRCQINREIRERNSIKQQIREIAGEITKLITEKARSIYGRFEKLRRALGDPEGARADTMALGVIYNAITSSGYWHIYECRVLERQNFKQVRSRCKNNSSYKR